MEVTLLSQAVHVQDPDPDTQSKQNSASIIICINYTDTPHNLAKGRKIIHFERKLKNMKFEKKAHFKLEGSCN